MSCEVADFVFWNAPRTTASECLCVIIWQEKRTLAVNNPFVMKWVLLKQPESELGAAEDGKMELPALLRLPVLSLAGRNHQGWEICEGWELGQIFIKREVDIVVMNEAFSCFPEDNNRHTVVFLLLWLFVCWISAGRLWQVTWHVPSLLKTTQEEQVFRVWAHKWAFQCC